MPVEFCQHGGIAKAAICIPYGEEGCVKARFTTTTLPHAIGCSIGHGDDHL